MKFGLDRLVGESSLRAPLAGKRVALLAHPASVTEDLTHALDALAACGGLNISAAFGPQHGLRGDKQDNMIESPDFDDPVHGIPVFSLYGDVRRPTDAMMDTFDVMLVDLQDLGCRIYTFVTTLRYMLEAAARHGKAVWVLDRPNPAGRPVEGLSLRPGWESFVGAGPMPMRHGLTLGELGLWFIATLKLDVEYRIVEMQDWRPDSEVGKVWIDRCCDDVPTMTTGTENKNCFRIHAIRSHHIESLPKSNPLLASGTKPHSKTVCLCGIKSFKLV
jgi:uncharacterized protein YbbC (DUF1343 family)